MRSTPAVILALLVSGLAACGDGGGLPAVTPEGPTTLSLIKTVVGTGPSEFRFTLELTNTGENAAINVAASDVWQQGLEVTAVGSVEGQQPEEIGDFGLEVTFPEFEPGKSVQVVYTARCRQSGEWDNTAVASSANSGAAEARVGVTCP